MKDERVLERSPLVLDQSAREVRSPCIVHMEPYPARLPPRWDQVGYRSIFAAQSVARPAEVD